MMEEIVDGIKETIRSITTDNAVCKGRAAYLEGLSRTANPYKEGPHSSKDFWDIGWEYQKDKDA